MSARRSWPDWVDNIQDLHFRQPDMPYKIYTHAFDMHEKILHVDDTGGVLKKIY